MLNFLGGAGLGFVYSFEVISVLSSSGPHAFVQLLEVAYSFLGILIIMNFPKCYSSLWDVLLRHWTPFFSLSC